RRVRLAEDDEAGVANSAHERRVRGRHVVRERARRERRPDAARLGEVLDRDRNTRERSRPWVTRFRERFVGADRDVAVQRAVEAIDALEVLLDDLDRGDGLLTDEPRLYQRGKGPTRHSFRTVKHPEPSGREERER